MPRIGSPATLARRDQIAVLTLVVDDLEEQDIVPVRRRRKSTKCSYNSRSCHHSCKVYPDLKLASRRSPRRWPRAPQRFQVLNKLLAASQPALPPWKQVQLMIKADPGRQDLGMAPQPLGPLGPRPTVI